MVKRRKSRIPYYCTWDYLQAGRLFDFEAMIRDASFSIPGKERWRRRLGKSYRGNRCSSQRYKKISHAMHISVPRMCIHTLFQPQSPNIDKNVRITTLSTLSSGEMKISFENQIKTLIKNISKDTVQGLTLGFNNHHFLIPHETPRTKLGSIERTLAKRCYF